MSLARLAPGRSLLEPALRTARALDRLSAPTRAALRERLERWLDAQIDRHLRPLKQLAAAATDPGKLARRPRARGDARRCRRRCSRARPRSAPSPISSRPTARRCTSCASASARSTCSCRRCSSPPRSIGARRCSRCAGPADAARCPPPARRRSTADADPRGAALAYRRLGRSWLRIDLADRLASHARKVRSAGGDDPVDQALATSVGLDEDALARLMDEIGFTRAGDAWRWRGRRGPRPDHRTRTQSHAFAELAKLTPRA